MNPTPPLPPARIPHAGRIASATGDLPPLNARFLAHLDKTTVPRNRRRIIVSGLVTVSAVLTSLFALYLVVVKNAARAEDVLLCAILIALVGIYELFQGFQDQKQQERTRRVVQNGVPVTAYLVQANQLLFSPGKFPALPCLVLFSFQPEVAGDALYMASLAERVFRLKQTTPPNADGQTVAQMTTNERAVLYRRRELPLSFTDGSTIYCADLWIKRAYVPNGHLQTRQLICLAEPGETGGLELVPSFLL